MRGNHPDAVPGKPDPSAPRRIRYWSFPSRAFGTTADANVGGMGWDQFGVAGVIKLRHMNLPSGDANIRGQQKAFASELYYDVPIAPYTAVLGGNYVATLAQVAAGTILTDWGGLIVTFLALLEMIRLQLVRVFQAGSLGPIRVYKRPRPPEAPHPIGDPEAPRG